jgi:outer membrane protein OmpA-like peptidoglycan-associated protein
MFAPRLATAQSKTAESSAKSNARQRPEPIRRNLGLNAAERVQMLQRTIGNQAVLRLLAQEAANRAADRPADKGPGSGSSWSFARISTFPHGQAEHQQQRLPLTTLPFRGVIQPKLEIGAVNDPLEAEADRVAEQVMRTPDPVRRATPSEENVVRRSCVACEEDVSGQTCAACEAEEKKQEPPIKLSRKDSDGAAALDGTAAPSIVEEVLRSPGQPLATQELDFFGPRFGFDLSRVRIHTGHTAAESAQSVNALAYASGANIVFAAGQYRPGTEQGRRLLAHELAHVGQQNFGDGGRIRRLGDVRKVPAGLGCTIPDWNAPGDEFVLFPNMGTTLRAAEKAKIGAYLNRHHETEPNKGLRVDGYASEPGGDALNWKLSCLRASAVMDELMHPSASKYPVPKVAISLFMQGETAEFGPEAQNRRATISSASHIIRVEQPKIPVEQPKTTTGGGSGTGDPKDAGVPGQYPPPFMSCAVNPDCPDTYCRPFDTLKQALADRTSDGESVLSTIATANPHAEPLFRRYVFSPGPAGDISAEYGSDFASSRTTRYVSEQIHRLVEADIKSNPPTFPTPDSWATVDYETDRRKDSLKQQFNQLATSGLVYTDPFEVPGLIAGGIGANQGFCTVGANTSGAQEDSRSARVSAQVFKNTDGSMIINPIVNYTVVDTLDFCPGNCGGFFARHLGNTVQMSRWEASGISGDVPFTVNFQGPPLIGAYNSED